MSLKIFNTLSGEKEIFSPLNAGEVRMYVCGVTVYDSSHVGHARSLLTFDVIYRYLEFLGYRVTFVRNFTDIDDKIIKRAKDEKTTAGVIAEKYIAEFYRDSDSLGLVRPQYEPKATEHITEIIALILRLEEKGMAYRVDGDVFFSVERFASYGKLSSKNIEELEAGARVEVDARKRSPMDFALWKSSKEGEPSWGSRWGPGRPGWHIECSAMSTKFLGQPFDIHGGGKDLVFPHHENEIAQSEGAADLPLARYWIHNGFLNINKEKMAKSLGNILTIQEALAACDRPSLRHYFLGSHYRSPLDFSYEGLEESGKAVERIYETIERMGRESPSSPDGPDESLLEVFRQEMDDDFNTPKALALMFDEIRSLNRALDEGKTRVVQSRGLALKKIGEVLGLLIDAPEKYFKNKKKRWLNNQGLSVETVEEMIEQRECARKGKNWEQADRIRAQLLEKGVVLEDTPRGTVWKVR